MNARKFVEIIARLKTFEESYRDALAEEGVTNPQEIADRMEAAQTDLDYLIGCEESLECLILEARKVLVSNLSTSIRCDECRRLNEQRDAQFREPQTALDYDLSKAGAS